MMRVQVWYFAGLLFTAAAARAEYLRSAGEGAMQTGVRDERGYRLAGLSQDVFGGRRWAEVRSGKHPERAAALVALEDGSSAEAYPAHEDAGVETEPRLVLVAAGSRVTVVSAEATMPLEMMGVAVESGAAGGAGAGSGGDGRAGGGADCVGCGADGGDRGDGALMLRTEGGRRGGMRRKRPEPVERGGVCGGAGWDFAAGAGGFARWAGAGGAGAETRSGGEGEGASVNEGEGMTMLHYTGHMTEEQVRAMRKREGGGIWLLLVVIVGLVVWAEMAAAEVMPKRKARVTILSMEQFGISQTVVYGRAQRIARE